MEINKELIREVEETMRKSNEVTEYFNGFRSRAFPNGDMTPNNLAELANARGEDVNELVDSLHKWIHGK